MQPSLRKILLVTLTSLSVSALAGTAHDHLACGGVVHGEGARPYLETIRDIQANTHASSMALTQSEITYVDVAVVMHNTWLASLATRQTADDNGKPYENGAQFAMKRINAQFEGMNAVFEKQNVNTRLRPVYFAIATNDIIPTYENTSEEYNNVFHCLMLQSPFDDPDFRYGRNFCEAQGLQRITDLIKDQVDVVYYVRDLIVTQADDGSALRENMLGRATNGQFLTVFDNYTNEALPEYLSNKELPFYQEMIASARFGLRNRGIFMHEMGHVFGADHSFAAGTSNNPHGCGEDPKGMPVLPGDPRLLLPTIMHVSGGSKQHEFFSDPDIIINGDPCGIPGEADNLSAVKEHANVIHLNSERSTPNSEIALVEDHITINRAAGKATITLRRTGDLSLPAYFNVIANDGTAWEGRDFIFGLQEVRFLPGESEATLDVTLLPRHEGHSDTTFTIAINAAINTSFSPTPVQITLQSDIPLSHGNVEFETNVLTTQEGAGYAVDIIRTGGMDGDITFLLRTQDGSAVEGIDHNAINEVITLRDKETRYTVNHAALQRPGTQGERTFQLTLSDVTGGASLGAYASLAVKVNDTVNAGELTLAATELTAFEGQEIPLQIERRGGSDGELTVTIKTVQGVALSGVDFVAMNETVLFKEGQTTATVGVRSIAREGEQGVRAFDVTLSDTSVPTALGSPNTTRITLNDVVPTTHISFSTSTLSVEEGMTGTVQLLRTGDIANAAIVTVTTQGGTAAAGLDFTAINQVITFPAGEASATINLNTLDRTGLQGSRYLDLTLNSPQGAALGSNDRARVTITDRIPAPEKDTAQPASGGAISFVILPLLLLLGYRRRQHHS